MTKRFTALKVVLGANLLLACSLAALLLAPNVFDLLPALLASGAASGTITALVTAYIALSATADTKGTVMALNSTAFRASQSVSPLLSGLLFSLGGFPMVYGVAAVVALSVTGLVGKAFRRPPESRE